MCSSLSFSFLSNFITFPCCLQQFTFPSLVHEGTLFSTSSLALMFCPFGNSHSDRYEVIAYYGLLCIFQMISEVKYLLLCLLGICVLPLENCLFSSSAHFLIRLFVFWYWVIWVFYIVWILTTYKACNLQIFSPI